jgi:tRNA A-37 threonylcarbamoyl transferase component Bud32
MVSADSRVKKSKSFAQEAQVCRLLLNRDLRGIVRVFQVNETTIWEQGLEKLGEIDRRSDSDDLRDIEAGLKNLHRLGIAHLDVCARNIGYDPVRKQWCLVDFDSAKLLQLDDDDTRNEDLITRDFLLLEKLRRPPQPPRPF